MGESSAEGQAKAVANSEITQPPVSRRTFGKRALVFGAVLLGLTPNSAEAQTQIPPEKKPTAVVSPNLPEQSKPAAPTSLIDVSPPEIIQNPQIAAMYKAKTEGLVASAKNVMPTYSNSIRIRNFKGEGYLDYGSVQIIDPDSEKVGDEVIFSSVDIYTPDTSKSSLEIALLLTGRGVGEVINRANNKYPSSNLEYSYNKQTGGNLKADQDAEVMRLFNLQTYSTNPKFKELNGPVSVAEADPKSPEEMFKNMYAIARLRPDKLMEQLIKSREISRSSAENAANIVLTAIKLVKDCTTKDVTLDALGFSEEFVKKLSLLGGSKINLFEPAPKSALK